MINSKLIITLLFFFTIISGFSQVGIGNTDPKATLDITATNETGTTTNVDGIIIPRVTRERAQSMLSIPTSTLIYVNEVVTGSAAGTTINVTAVGYYYFNGTVWEQLKTGKNDWALTGNAGTTAGTNFIGTTGAEDIRFKTNSTDRWNISHTNDGQLQSYSLGTAALPTYSFQPNSNTGLFSSGTNNLDFSTNGTARMRIPSANQIHALSLGTAALPFYSFSADTGIGMWSPTTSTLAFSTTGAERMRIDNVGNVGIGTTADVSAKLDVSDANRGFLMPRVALTSTTATGPITTPATSLFVYNTATAGLSPNNVVPGYYYNSGTTGVPVWKRFSTGNGDGWLTSGNAGTTAGTNFIGTTDAIDLAIRTNNTERMRVLAAGNVGINVAPNTSFQLLVSSAISSIYGASTLPTGTGVLGSGNNIASATLANGSGGAFSSTNVGVYGFGNNTAASWGVLGTSANATGTGVQGVNSAAAGTAIGFGGYFTNNQTGGSGVAGSLGLSSNFAGAGVSGITVSTLAGGVGVIGACNNATGVGVQGQTSGAGAATGVVGIASGANVGAVGVFGQITGAGSGTSFLQTAVRKDIFGAGNSVTGNYHFGVYGAGGLSTRSGGVMGHNTGNAFWAAGALGYYNSGALDYGVYGFGLAYTTGAAAGRMANPGRGSLGSLDEPNSMIGLGIYGGVMGGWIKGLVYGTNMSGAKYGAYVHGKTLTNDFIATLTETGNSSQRIATYAPSAMKVEVSDKGTGKLLNGKTTVSFSRQFSPLLSSEEPIIITVTPMGNSQGLYIEKMSSEGFTVVENNHGASNITFNWIAIGVKKGFENPSISPEILNAEFEEIMNGNSGVMYNDNNPETPTHSIWWDGTQVRFDIPPVKLFSKTPEKSLFEYQSPIQNETKNLDVITPTPK